MASGVLGVAGTDGKASTGVGRIRAQVVLDVARPAESGGKVHKVRV